MSSYFTNEPSSLEQEIQDFKSHLKYIENELVENLFPLKMANRLDWNRFEVTRQTIQEVIQENTIKTLNKPEIRLQILAHKLLDEAGDPALSFEHQRLLNQAFMLICEVIAALESRGVKQPVSV